MSKDISAAKRRSLDTVVSAITRAKDLRAALITDGRYEASTGVCRPLPNHDKRDITVLVFFEMAAAFEYFAQETFILATRKRFNVNPKNAERIAGTIDRGLQGVMGWGAPSMIVSRARHLFGKRHILSRLEQSLPKDCYQTLNNAHRVRNRIAHQGPKARAEVNKLLREMGVPQAERKGLSMGRLLSDYPRNAVQNDRWFDRFMAAYGSYADLIRSKL